MPRLTDSLTARQQALLRSWLPDAEPVRDHSWGLVGTRVLELRASDGSAYVAKAGDEADHHIAREIEAHRRWLRPWTSRGRAPAMVAADADAKLLVTRWLPGRLVQADRSEVDPGIYHQAGALLALFHGQSSVQDDGQFEGRQKAETLAWLAADHRIDATAVSALTALVERWPTPRSLLVPTHGDWQPRNWVVHDGVVGVIDFGRADLRPAHTDLGRLVAQQFRKDPSLEAAFLEGYGADPREPEAWMRLRVRDAVGTAAWAYKVGDAAFEEQGHRMIAAVLAELDM
ncbi:Phosphotransferase enzyme family protein [Nocardioides terrae]|uniref:Phosphotransferase enzyme family protein n=1 Tax=Nocardioides terrae TaxID=574651 RepID=A0A1I1NGD6_9ACTN|nr:aminoglycoside phosphotransferase family protein [Nocardioides terrae]SFC96496.1 Phosphotransferase enzyme family protein [Nocardioides terrae]